MSEKNVEKRGQTEAASRAISDPPTCGLVMPISAIGDYSEQHWIDVSEIIKEALRETDFKVELVSDANEVGIIQGNIVQNLYGCDLVVCDVSAKNPNVMFELGMRLAFDKPAIIIKDDATSYSFDTSPIEHLPYPKDLRYPAMQAFKGKLREKALATLEASRKPEYRTFLKHFGKFVVASVETKSVGKEDYILEQLEQVRAELRSMARTQARDRLATPAKFQSFVGTMAPTFDAERERDFVRNYLVKTRTSVSQLADSGSAEFGQLLEEFAHHFGLLSEPYSVVQRRLEIAIIAAS
jgi:hypothetical protein